MYPVGRWYLPTNHPTANEQHQATWSILREFNALSNTDPARSRELLRHLFPRSEFLPEAWAPLHLELGVNTRFGEGCFINFNCTILDVAPVDIGARTLFGPGCQLITVGHPSTTTPRAPKGGRSPTPSPSATTAGSARAPWSCRG